MPTTITSGERGAFRVDDGNDGYAIYVGVDALPDFTLPPAEFSATLPHSFAAAPPGSGLRTYNVTVRKRDGYGLESQNQDITPITINSAGVLQLPAMSNPSRLVVTVEAGGYVRIRAVYDGFSQEDYPANEWRIWIDTTAPDPDVDPPSYAASITAGVLSLRVGPHAANDYFLALALYRQFDAAQSDALTAEFTIPVAPDPIVPVPGGLEIP